MARVVIGQSAWDVIVSEVEHFAKLPGSGKQGYEAVVIPLFGFFRKEKSQKAPWETLDLSDIDEFVVTHCFVPPRKFCDHGPVTAGFSFGENATVEEFQEYMDAWSIPITRTFPTLEVGHVHSHQFAWGRTWPSGTDKNRLEESLVHYRMRKLGTPFEVIICRKTWRSREWKACCFGFDQGQNLFSLGSALIVPDNHLSIRRLLTVPYYRMPSGEYWERIQHSQLPNLAILNQPFGWKTYRTSFGDGRHLFVHLPPWFPSVDHILYQVADESRRTYGEMQILRIGFGTWLSLSDVVLRVQHGHEPGQVKENVHEFA